MSQTHSTTDASTLRPWQFFTLLALFCATVAVFFVRGTSPENVILICLSIGSAALVGLGALRTFWPLVTTEPFEAEMVGNRTRAALEREKNLLLRSIKELEFDHAMGKISPADYDDMVAGLRARAVRLLKQLDGGAGTGYREIIERELASRLGKLGAATLAAAAGAAEAAPYEEPAPSGARGEPPSLAGSEATASYGEPRRSAERGGGGQGAKEAAVGRDIGRACASCDTVNEKDARFCKGCGAKLVALLLAAVLAFAAPAFAQLQMPDAREMAGIPRPVTDLPEGHVSVRLIRGDLSNNIPGHPVELQAGSTTVTTVKTDENGRAEFSGVAAGTSVKAVAAVDGERLESEEFPWPGQGGIRVLLVATPKGGAAAAPALPAQPGNVILGDQTRVIVDLADDTLQVYYLLDIQNPAKVPVNPVNAFVLEMPTGALSTAVIVGAPQAVARGDRVTVVGPFAPGRTDVQVAYSLPYSGGETTLTQTVPVPTGSLSVLMKKAGAVSLTSPQLPAQEERDFEGGRYVLAQGPPLPGGGTLTLNLSGLPHHSPVPRRTALTLVAMIFGIAFWTAVRVPSQGGNTSRVKHLTGKREKIFTELVRLEQQRRTGSLDAARYAERRAALIAQLERVYRDLDAESGQGLAA